jgi:hypothetical protein
MVLIVHLQTHHWWFGMGPCIHKQIRGLRGFFLTIRVENIMVRPILKYGELIPGKPEQKQQLHLLEGLSAHA